MEEVDIVIVQCPKCPWTDRFFTQEIAKRMFVLHCETMHPALAHKMKRQNRKKVAYTNEFED